MHVPYNRQKIKRRWKPLLQKRVNRLPDISDAHLAFLMGMSLFSLLLLTGLPRIEIKQGAFRLYTMENFSLPEEPGLAWKDLEEPHVEKAAVSLPWQDHSAAEEPSFRQIRLEGGERLGQLAYSYGLLPETLISLNKLESPEDLYPGRVLLIPAKDGKRISLSRREAPLSAAIRMGLDPLDMQELPGSREYFVPLDPPESSYWNHYFKLPHNGRILQGYGPVKNPLTGVETLHKGVDFKGQEGEAVYAVERGRVIELGVHSFFGKYMILSHPNGYQSFYGHLEDFVVSESQLVKKGEIVGRLGQSGQAESTQLHFSLFLNEKMVDPMEYLF